MEQEEGPNPKAGQVILEIMRPITVAQMRAYLEGTGWTLWANRFHPEKRWSLDPDLASPSQWIYKKPDPDDEEFVVQVPGRPEHENYQRVLQSALERIALVEQTTFLVVVCRVRGVQQLVLRLEEDR